MTKINCADCFYFDPYYAGSKTGLCRRHAPLWTKDVMDNLAPQVIDTDWCGESAPKEGAPAQTTIPPTLSP